ncbi:hypothetical protein CN238_18750 [Sinorhizobium meliloti]|nr:hypothetical protein CN238_18750 [Sinorhizobium meliloti]RVH27597.1 hypothetical protein CN214_19525 [Sinorhizobium meliloti]
MKGEGGLPALEGIAASCRLCWPLCSGLTRGLALSPQAGRGDLLHVSFNPIRLKDKNMQQIKVLQRPLRV